MTTHEASANATCFSSSLNTEAEGKAWNSRESGTARTEPRITPGLLKPGLILEGGDRVPFSAQIPRWEGAERELPGPLHTSYICGLASPRLATQAAGATSTAHQNSPHWRGSKEQGAAWGRPRLHALKTTPTHKTRVQACACAMCEDWRRASQGRAGSDPVRNEG